MVQVDVGRAGDVTWSVKSGTRIYRDRVLLDRPRIIGAGAFTVPALPLAVVYEPPPDEHRLNQATYSVTTSLATSVQVSGDQPSAAATKFGAGDGPGDGRPEVLHHEHDLLRVVLVRADVREHVRLRLVLPYTLS